MSDYKWFMIYLIIGFVAGYAHWLKKRYVDETTQSTFSEYLKQERKSTYNYLSAVVIAEIALSLAHTGLTLTLTDFVAAFGAGYMADSGLNKSPDNFMHINSEEIVNIKVSDTNP
jgi:hypothetical protein